MSRDKAERGWLVTGVLILVGLLGVAIVMMRPSKLPIAPIVDVVRHEPDLPHGPDVPVIVELFTARGCTPCPAAEALLQALDTEQPLPGVLVIPLGMHIDYWNHRSLDPFSEAMYTERQRSYHPGLGSRVLYTPEVVVDGRMNFVGGPRKLAEHAVMRAAALEKAVVHLAARMTPPDRIDIQIDVTDMSALPRDEDLALWVAVTEVGLGGNDGDDNGAAERRDNAGGAGHDASGAPFPRVSNAAVVRMLTRVDTISSPRPRRRSASAALTRHPDWRSGSVRVVAFLQGEQSRHIHGAAQIRLE